MPTIRDLVAALRRREGVDAAVVLGRDGLLIDGETSGGVDAESMAALVPAIVNAAEDYGAHDSRGALGTVILEFAQGVAVISVLSRDAILLVLTRPGAHVAPLLFELRRNRDRIAALI